MNPMVTRMAGEISRWRAEHHGCAPRQVRVPKALYDQLAMECGWVIPGKTYGVMMICGVKILEDKPMRLGEFDE